MFDRHSNKQRWQKGSEMTDWGLCSRASRTNPLFFHMWCHWGGVFPMQFPAALMFFFIVSKAAEDSVCCEIWSFIRSLHAYDWNPSIGQILELRWEPDHHWDKQAVAIVKADGAIVDHIPYNLAPIVSPILAEEFDKGRVEVTGNRVNHSAGYGLETQCIYMYQLNGPKKFTHVEECIVKLQSRALLSSESYDWLFTEDVVQCMHWPHMQFISSKVICIVLQHVGSNYVSTIQNMEVSTFQRVAKYYKNRGPSGTHVYTILMRYPL